MTFSIKQTLSGDMNSISTKLPGSRLSLVVIINGYSAIGKDEFCNKCIRPATMRGIHVHNYSTVDPVRKIMTDLGIQIEPKTNEIRTLTADLKKRLEAHDFAITRFCVEEVRRLLERYRDGICFVHIREPELIEKFRELMLPHFAVKTVLVKRPGTVQNGYWDAQVDNFDYDVTVHNSGTLDDLSKLAENFIDDIQECKLKKIYFPSEIPSIAALAEVIQSSAQNGNDSPVDYGDAEGIAKDIQSLLKGTLHA